MKKYKIMTAKNAVKKGLVKVGDVIWIKVKVREIHKSGLDDDSLRYLEKSKIRIPIPEKKPIDFGEAGRVLVKKENNLLICTTGYFDGNHFSGYLLQDTEEFKKGYTSNNWAMQEIWQDITDTYEK